MAHHSLNMKDTISESHSYGASTLFKMSWEAVAQELDLPPSFYEDISYHYLLWRRVVLGRVRDQIRDMLSLDGFLKRLASLPTQDEIWLSLNGSSGLESCVYDHDLEYIRCTVTYATKSSEVFILGNNDNMNWNDPNVRGWCESDGRRVSEGGTTCHLPFRISEMISSQLLLRNVTLAFGMPPDLGSRARNSAWRVELVFADDSRLNLHDSSGKATANYYGSVENSSQAVLLLDHLLTMNEHRPWYRNIGPSCKTQGTRLYNTSSIPRKDLNLMEKLRTSHIEELTSEDKKDAVHMYKSFLTRQQKVSMILLQMPLLDRAVLLASFSVLCSCQKNRKHGVSGHIRTLISGNLRDSFEHCDLDEPGFNIEDTDGMVRWDTNDFNRYSDEWSFASNNHLWKSGTLDHPCSSQLITYTWPHADGGKYHLGSLISAHLLYYRLVLLFGLENPLHRERSGFVWEFNLKTKGMDEGYLCFSGDDGQPRATFVGTELASMQALRCLGYLTSMYCLEGR